MSRRLVSGALSGGRWVSVARRPHWRVGADLILPPRWVSCRSALTVRIALSSSLTSTSPPTTSPSVSQRPPHL